MRLGDENNFILECCRAVGSAAGALNVLIRNLHQTKLKLTDGKNV